MPAFHTERSIAIDAPAERVFETIADYSTWPIWSPWLMLDSSAQVEFSDDPRSVGSGYHWSGELVGEGEMEHRQLDRHHRIDAELRFIKPVKSVNRVAFDLLSIGASTQVTWHLDGKLPFFLFFMKSNLETFIGMDYERGLRMLKEFIETGEVASRIDITGVEPVAEKRVVGVRDSSSLDDIAEVMDQAFKQVEDRFGEAGVEPSGDTLSLYLPSSDPKSKRFDFVCGYEIDDSPQVNGLSHHRLDGGRYLKVRHVGRYENLGNAWSAAYQFARYKKIKIAKRAGFEVYLNRPADTAPVDRITDVHVPVK